MSEGASTKEPAEGPDLAEAAQRDETAEARVRGQHVTLGMLLDAGKLSAFSDRVVTRPGTRGVWLRGALQ